MATILTVCIAQVPADVVNHFLRESLQTADQTEVDRKGTKPDIQDFASGVQNKTEDEVRHLIHEWIERNGRSGGISNPWIAVLDSKSMEDETHEQPGVDVRIHGHARVCEDGYIWWKWRVPFRFGFYFWNSITSCGMEASELYCRPEYLRAEGSVDMDTCSKIIDGNIEDPMDRM